MLKKIILMCVLTATVCSFCENISANEEKVLKAFKESFDFKLNRRGVPFNAGYSFTLDKRTYVVRVKAPTNVPFFLQEVERLLKDKPDTLKQMNEKLDKLLNSSESDPEKLTQEYFGNNSKMLDEHSSDLKSFFEKTKRIIKELDDKFRAIPDFKNHKAPSPYKNEFCVKDSPYRFLFFQSVDSGKLIHDPDAPHFYTLKHLQNRLKTYLITIEQLQAIYSESIGSQQSTIHCDLRPQNIAVQETISGGIPTITEVQLLNVLEKWEFNGRFFCSGGSPGYDAPEAAWTFLTNNIYSDPKKPFYRQRAEVYSLGVIIAESELHHFAFESFRKNLAVLQTTKGEDLNENDAVSIDTLKEEHDTLVSELLGRADQFKNGEQIHPNLNAGPVLNIYMDSLKSLLAEMLEFDVTKRIDLDLVHARLLVLYVLYMNHALKTNEEILYFLLKVSQKISANFSIDLKTIQRPINADDLIKFSPSIDKDEQNIQEVEESLLDLFNESEGLLKTPVDSYDPRNPYTYKDRFRSQLIGLHKLLKIGNFDPRKISQAVSLENISNSNQPLISNYQSIGIGTKTSHQMLI